MKATDGSADALPPAAIASDTAAEATALPAQSTARMTRTARKAPAALAVADVARKTPTAAPADIDSAHPATSKAPPAQDQTLNLAALLTGNSDSHTVEADASGNAINGNSPSGTDRSADAASAANSASLTAPVAALFLTAAQTPATARTVATDDAPASNTARPLGIVTAAGTGSVKGLTALLTDTAHAQSEAAQAAFAASLAASPDGGPDADSATSASSATDASATAAAALAHLAATTHASARDSDLPRGELRAAVGTPDWNNELGQQLTWMSQKGIDSASLHLSPAHLGPLQVQISVQNGAASVWFGASHADTRAALERALPQLRQMFASQGLALTDSGVSREPPRNATRSNSAQSIAAVSAVGAPAGAATAATISLGLIDTYA
ncbi:MAG: flagellar hook-length control protein FliK [Sinobacteraceae bacterium]|nr:flagellar hook-length control protein FliK [Nevskiaceae bacterium]